MSGVITIDRLRYDSPAIGPLRIETLTLDAGQRLAVLGLEAAAAEILVGLITGGILPAAGLVRIFGRDTSDITNADHWLATLDRVGILSPRSVFVSELSVAQNLALASTLSVDPIADEVMSGLRQRAVEAGVPLDQLDRPYGEAPADVRARCHLARALAPDPALLLLEYADALTAPADAAAFGRDIARVAEGRRLAVLALTADTVFARSVARRVARLERATGALSSRSSWWS